MKKKQPNALPTFDDMMLPTIEALRQLGGSGTVAEIYEKVTQILQIPEGVLSVPHGSTSLSEVEYRLNWSRTYLRKYGVLENSSRGVWSIAKSAPDLDTLDPKTILRDVREMYQKSRVKTTDNQTADNVHEPVEDPDDSEKWQERLHKVLMGLTPSAFERLAQRLLRESGFIRVEVTGETGDGGIDGIGIARVAGFLSFQVLFQCKRYQGAVTSGQIRDFRGAMQGRTDKGLFITTGTFTRDAIKEATRDGAPPIDLIDGEELVKRLKELGLGVKIEMVEAVEVDADWFAKI